MNHFLSFYLFIFPPAEPISRENKRAIPLYINLNTSVGYTQARVIMIMNTSMERLLLQIHNSAKQV